MKHDGNKTSKTKGQPNLTMIIQKANRGIRPCQRSTSSSLWRGVTKPPQLVQHKQHAFYLTNKLSSSRLGFEPKQSLPVAYPTNHTITTAPFQPCTLRPQQILTCSHAAHNAKNELKWQAQSEHGPPLGRTKKQATKRGGGESSTAWLFFALLATRLHCSDEKQ